MERWSTHIYYNYLHSSTYTGYRYSLENRVLGRVLKTGFGRVLKTGFGEDSEIGFWGVLRNRVYGNRLKNGFSYIPPATGLHPRPAVFESFLFPEGLSHISQAAAAGGTEAGTAARSGCMVQGPPAPATALTWSGTQPASPRVGDGGRHGVRGCRIT